MITRPDTAPAVSQPAYRLRWLAAAVMIVGALMDMIDLTIVNVALPTIRRDLQAGATELEWVISGYMLAFAAALIIAGSLGDRVGRKRVFLAGVGLFGAASLAAGLAQSPAQLIACRLIQGVAAAAMAPQILATFRTIFAPKERGQAFGMYGAMLGFASAIGLVLGGVLTEANLFGWSWRSVFLVNVPVSVMALIAGARFIPETRDPAARRPDLPGGALLAGSLVAIVYPLLEGRQLGWPAWAWALLAAGVAGLTVLGIRESRRRQPRVAPLLQPRLFRVPAFAAGLVVQLGFSAGLQGFFLMFALWLQAGEHFSPLRAGLTAIAFSAGSFPVAPFAVPLARKYGRRVLVLGAAGMMAGVLGVVLGARDITMAGSPWPIVPGLLVAGAGLSLLVIPLVNVVLAAVPAEVAGGASGLFSTAQQLGGAVGVAVLGTVFFGYADGHSLADAFIHAAPYSMGAFALCGIAALLLPRTAVADEVLTAD
ncbi:MAG TPA: MFS transporter [Streptosporangiaceae bacterium]|jgi:EmrB/QacA subfamily drug resistance transporter